VVEIEIIGQNMLEIALTQEIKKKIGSQKILKNRSSNINVFTTTFFYFKHLNF